MSQISLEPRRTKPDETQSSHRARACQAKAPHPSRAEDSSERAAHDFDDLYNEHAPAHTIAAGADFGRLAPLAALGAADVSALEKLVLADARCHYVVLKVVANGSETERTRLYGHTLIFPQEPSTEHCGGFNAAVLRAALGQVRIQFVGPSGERGKLERAALQLDDLRLRPEVVYNWLQLRAIVSGKEPPPTLEEIAALIHPTGAISAVEHGVEKQRNERGSQHSEFPV